MIERFLFPQAANDKRFSAFLLAMRILFGVLLMSHGVDKLYHFTDLAGGLFPDPLGIGSPMSVALAIFGELFCSFAFIIGFLYRLSMIPMIVTMSVAFVAIHGGSLSTGLIALVYLIVFIMMYIAGPGRYSVDHVIHNIMFDGRPTSQSN